MNYTTHCFSVELATKIGVREAIILQHLFWWHQHNASVPNMCIDGRVWFYIPVSQITYIFPYFTNNAVRTILDKLIEAGYLVKDHKGEGQQKFNRTNWYALTNSALSLFQFTISETPFVENHKSIVNSKDIKQEDINITPLKKDKKIPLPFEGAEFCEVWNTLIRQPKWRKKSEDALVASAKFLADYPEAIAVKIMRNTIRNDWQGLFPPKAEDVKAQQAALVQKVGRVHASVLRQAKELGWSREDLASRAGEEYAQEWDKYYELI